MPLGIVGLRSYGLRDEQFPGYGELDEVVSVVAWSIQCVGIKFGTTFDAAPYMLLLCVPFEDSDSATLLKSQMPWEG